MNDETKHEMKVFSNPLFGDVRTFVIDDIPWFVAVDVCDALDIGNSRQAVTRLDEDEKNTVIINDGTSGNPMKTIINESGLYALILTSRKEEAKQFKRWITHEVIPSIRKHGLYMTNSTLEQVSTNPELITALARQLLEEQEQKKMLQEELQTAKPKVDYFDQFINAYDSTNLRNTAKELGIPERDLVQFLLEKKYMYRDQDRKLMPYAEYTKRGYFIMKDYYRGNGKVYQYTLFTAKGKAHFQRLLEKRKRGE